MQHMRLPRGKLPRPPHAPLSPHPHRSRSPDSRAGMVNRPSSRPTEARLPCVSSRVSRWGTSLQPLFRTNSAWSTAECWGYNGSTPGPTIEAIEGDRVRIYVTNRLPEATTVHWHGMIVPNGMDGVAGLNQRPIPVGETYVYEFTLKHAGTFMYHPHFDEMTADRAGHGGHVHRAPQARNGAPRSTATSCSCRTSGASTLARRGRTRTR